MSRVRLASSRSTLLGVHLEPDIIRNKSGLNKRWRTTEGYSLENKLLKCVTVGPTVLSHWPTTEACFLIDASTWE